MLDCSATHCADVSLVTVVRLSCFAVFRAAWSNRVSTYSESDVDLIRSPL
jgi:hypothetical protein